MSKINSKTVNKVIKLLKATEYDTKFNEIYERIIKREVNLKVTDNDYITVVEYLLKTVKCEPTYTVGNYPAERLGILASAYHLDNTKRKFKNIRHINTPKEFKNISDDGVLRDFYSIEINSLYPRLIANSFKNWTLKLSYLGYYGFDILYTELVDNYIEIRREIYGYEKASAIFRFFINWTYSQLSYDGNNFLFQDSSKCPITEFHNEVMEAIEPLRIMHYCIDEFFVKTEEDKNKLVEVLTPIFEKFKLIDALDIEYHKEFQMTRGRHISWYATQEFKKKRSDELKRQKELKKQ